MLEVRDELLDRLNDLRLGEVLIGKDGLELVEETVDFGHAVADGLLDDAQGLEAVHVELFARDVEFLVGLLAGGVALEIDDGVIGGILFHLGGDMLCFGIRGAFFLAEPLGLDEIIADAAEGEHLVLPEFGEEDLAGIAQDAGEHANMAGFLRAHEVTLDIAGGGQRLTLLEAMEPSVRQRAVAEGHIGKARGGDLEVLVVGHHEVFHDPLAGTHDVHGVSSLIGGDAEEVLGRIDRQQVHQLLRLDVVVLDERLDAIPVLLRANMFVGGEVRNDIEALLLAEDTLEDGIGEVECVTAELLGDEETFRAAHIAHKLREAVLVEIHDDHALGFKTKDRLDEAGTDRAGAANDADLLVLNLLGELHLVRLNVRKEHADGAEGDGGGDEFI